MGFIFRKLTVGALGVKTWNVNFLETGFVTHKDLIVVSYSVISNGLPSTNRFRFQGKAVKVNSI
jgi:hypothetical protein